MFKITPGISKNLAQQSIIREDTRRKDVESMTKQEVKAKIGELIQNYGRFPKIDELASALDTNIYQTQQHLKALVADGFLTMQGNWYRKNPEYIEPSHHVEGVVSSETRTAPERPVERLVEVKAPVVKEKPKDAEQSWDLYAIRGVMGLVGIGAILVSLYFTYTRLKEGLPGPLALLLSVIMICFSVSAFEVVILFVSKQITSHWYRWIVAFIFTIFWGVVTTFTVTSTIAVQYNEHARLAQAKNAAEFQTKADKVLWQSLQQQKTELTQRIKEKRELLTEYSNINKSLVEQEKTETQAWRDNQYRLRLANSDMDKLNRDMNDILKKEATQLGKGSDVLAENIADFYDWLASILKADRDSVQFWMNMFPAVFIDVIAPAALAIALFLRRRRKITEQSL